MATPVTVPEFSGELHLAMTPADARVLRAQLSRAINRGLPIVLSVSESAGGRAWRRLHVNEAETYGTPASRTTVAALVERGATLTLGTEPDTGGQGLLVDGTNPPVTLPRPWPPQPAAEEAAATP